MRIHGKNFDNRPARERLLRLLRRWVLFTNRYPLLLRLNRAPYHLAVVALRLILKRHAEIAAAYARNSFGQGHWVPGLSDIDLTVIIKDGLARHKEFAFCDIFSRQYASLRRAFPMLGEVEFLHESHVGAWTSFAITGYESRYWKRLYGNHTLEPGYQEDEAQLKLDRLSHAVAIYHYMLLPSLTAPQTGDRISDLVPRRIVLKILRYLDVNVAAALRNKIERCDLLDALLLTLDHLVEKTKAHFLSQTTREARLDLQRLFNGGPYNLVRRQDPPPEILASEECRSSIEGIVSMTDPPLRTQILLRSDLSDEQRRQTTTTILRKIEKPVITEHHLFAYFLSYVNPLEHAMLLRERIISLGNDPLPLPDQPGEKSFRSIVCQSTVDMFTYPYSQSLRTSSGKQFTDLLFGWFLRTLRYLEDGVMEFEFHKLRDYFNQHHPEYEKAVGPLDALENPIARFALLRLLLDDLSRQMTLDRLHDRTAGQSRP